MVLQQKVESRLHRAWRETEQLRHSMRFWLAGIVLAAIVGLSAFYGVRGEEFVALASAVALAVYLLAVFAYKYMTVSPRRLKDTLSDLAEQGRALGTRVVQQDSSLPQAEMDSWADCCRDTLETYIDADAAESWEASVDRGRPSQRFSGLAEGRRVQTRNRLVAGSEWLEAFMETGSLPASQSETSSNAE